MGSGAQHVMSPFAEWFDKLSTNARGITANGGAA